jgi:hypothetical protein
MPQKAALLVTSINIPYEQSDYFGEHRSPLFDFLKSLGYDVRPVAAASALIINGFRFEVNYKSAASNAKSSYAREWAPKKSRFYTISSAAQIKIPINKPINKESLIKKINAVLLKKSEWAAKVKQADENKQKELTELFQKYKNVPGLKHVAITAGRVSICAELGLFYVNTNGKVSDMMVEQENIRTIEQVQNMKKNSEDLFLSIKHVVDHINNCGPLEAAYKTKGHASAYLSNEGTIIIN